AKVRLHGHVMDVGNCAGMLGVPAQQVTLDVGQRIDVHMIEEGTGPRGNKWVPAIPLPASSRPSVLVRSAISPDRATATYRAVRPGPACCRPRPRSASNPATTSSGKPPAVAP